MLALSIRQPWASLIVAGIKDVENRTWATAYRGPLMIHAAQREADLDVATWSRLLGLLGTSRERLPRGGVIGIVELVDCVRASGSPWHESGCRGFVLRDARPVPFRPVPGRLGLFPVTR